jgi:acetyl-CoA carboxylase biotin carboxyl carrier protein
LSLTAKDVAAILKALDASGFDTLELDMDGVKLQLRRSGAPPPVAAPQAALATAQPVALHSAPPVEIPPGTTPVSAPLLGIFYRAPRPGEPPYVEVGASVEPDTIVGIIEVMKLMNTVRAGVRGQVVAFAGRNGELVEHGEALLFVRPG